MRQYLRTIGRLEPSYVIRKFLDAQRIHNLTSYLQARASERVTRVTRLVAGTDWERACARVDA